MNDLSLEFRRLKRQLTLLSLLFLASAIVVGMLVSFYHHKRLAISYSMAARSSLIIHDVRQAIEILNPAVGQNFESIRFVSSSNDTVFALPNSEKLQSFPWVTIRLPIFSNPDMPASTLGTLEFIYSPTITLILIAIFWLGFVGFAMFAFGKGRSGIYRRHLQLLNMEKAEAVGKLARQVAHDIRAPASALRIFLDKRKHLMPANDVELVAGSTERIVGIAEDLLSKFRSSNLNSEPSSSLGLGDLKELIELIVDEKQILHGERVEIKVFSSSRLANSKSEVRISKKDWMILLSNLLENAVDAAAAWPARIELNLGADDERVILTCKDFGKGISSDVLVVVREKGGSFGKANGNGLGLTHLRNTVKNAGGSWDISSQVNAYTLVSVYLPKNG